MSLAKLAVIDILVEGPNDRHWGYELIRSSGVKSGSMYPILRQLEEWGWVVRRQELAASAHGRPRRYYYTLTTLGLAQAKKALAEAPKIVATRRQTAF